MNLPPEFADPPPSGGWARPVESGAATAAMVVPVGTARPVQRMPMRMSAWRALLELILVALGGAGGLVITAAGSVFWRPADDRWVTLATSGGAGLFALATCLLLLRLAGHRPRTIGWRFDRVWADVGIGLASLVLADVLLVLVVVSLTVAWPELLEDPYASQRAVRETLPAMTWPQIVLVMLGVVIWEEVVFRGFLLTRLRALTGRWWAAVPLSAVLFGLAHGYQGPLAVVMIAVLGTVLALLAVWRRSLLPGMTLHLVNNLMFMALLRLQESLEHSSP